MQDFLGKRAVKIYSNNPGMGGAYNKTFTYIVPGLSHSRERGSSMLNQTQLAIQVRAPPVSPCHHPPPPPPLTLPFTPRRCASIRTSPRTPSPW